MDAPALNPIAFAVPIFLLSIVVEAAVARKQGRRGYYYFGTALSDVAAGTVFQALEVFFKFIPLLIYAWVAERWSLIDWGDNPWLIWGVGLLAVDFAYYWWHRASHVVNVLWAVHAVHHQSEDFNLAVALRQPAFEPITWFFFYIPIALLGVPTEVFVAAYGLDLLYQFFIHTELVDRLPRPLEWLLNTPSHHRVHHGVQAQYLDKNYGGILVVWDRLFGTFEPEDERVVYGTTVPLASYNPVWCNLQYFEHMARLARKATRLRDKLWVWVAHPAWLPKGVERDPHEKKRLSSEKYRPPMSARLAGYLGGHYLLIGTLMFEAQFSWTQRAVGAGVIVVSNLVFLGLVERKRWAQLLEIVRGPLVALAIGFLATVWFERATAMMIGLGVLAVMLASLKIYRPSAAATT